MRIRSVHINLKRLLSAFICARLRHLRAMTSASHLAACSICALLLLLLSSCSLDGELEECRYNVRLEYWYTGSGTANVLPDYIHSMQEFIFDDTGILRQVNNLVDRNKILYGEFTLSPGKYTLVTWANVDTASHVNEAVIGKTKLSDMQLSLDNPYSTMKSEYAYWQKNAEKLYYGYTTFSVRERGVSRQRVDMVHSHCKLNIMVKWTGRSPANTNNFVMTLRDVPSSYTFSPEYEIKGSPSSYYSESDVGITRAGIFYYIPQKMESLVDHRIDVKMEITGSVSGEFVTYRLTNDTHPLFCLYAGDTPVIKEIDLWKYFRTMQINLDENLRQEFDLVVEVDPSGGIIVSSAVVMDWNDGGSIGGFI